MPQMFNKNTINSFKYVIKKKDVFYMLLSLQSSRERAKTNNYVKTRQFKQVFYIIKISDLTTMNKYKMGDVDSIFCKRV